MLSKVRMCFIAICLILGFGYIAKKGGEHLIGEYYYTKARRFFAMGKKLKKSRMIVEAGKYYTKAIEYNNKEYLYTYGLAEVLFQLYAIKPNIKLIDSAIYHCNKTLKYSYEKHMSYLCLAQAYYRKRDMQKTVEAINKAKSYIPYNKTLEDIRGKLLKRD